MTTCQPYLFVTKRKTFATYRRRTYSRWQIALNPMVISSDTAYKYVVISVHAEKHNIDIYNHTSSLIPQVTPVHLMLHRQRYIRYENVFMS
jgi:hypothetical protein